MDWTNGNYMSCNFSKCKELIFSKKGQYDVYTSIGNIPQCNEFPILGIKFQPDCKFSLHVRNKLREANKCLYILRSLRKEGLD